MKTKACVNCKREYPLSFFPTRQKNYKVFRLPICKDCAKK